MSTPRTSDSSTSDLLPHRAPHGRTGGGDLGIAVAIEGWIGFERLVHHRMLDARHLARHPALERRGIGRQQLGAAGHADGGIREQRPDQMLDDA